MLRFIVLIPCLLGLVAPLDGCDSENAAVPANAGATSDAPSAEKVEESLIAAERYFDAGKLAEAEAILTDLVEDAPNNIDANEMLARVIFTRAAVAEQSFDFAQAEALFSDAAERYDRVVELEPNHAGWRQNAGDFALKAERRERALEHYAEAERLDPVNPRHPLFRAQVLLQQDRAVDAEQAVHRALELDDASAHGIATLASIRFQQERLEEAFSLIREARDLARPGEAAGFRVIEARFARLSGDAGVSIRLLSTLSAPERADLAVAEEMAHAYHDLGEHEYAVQAWAHAYEASADWKAAVGAAAAALRAGQPMQAESWLHVAESTVGDHPRVQEVKAQLTALEHHD